MAEATRRIWLCADDYGLSPGVNAAIRDLILRGRLNATSVMTAAPHCGPDETVALDMLNSGRQRAALGLHVTLTAPFAPLSPGFAPLRAGAFPPMKDMLRLASARRLNVEALAVEIAIQLRKFLEIFGRLPDFVDGHQHVHLFPQVRDAFLRVVAETAPNAWVRQCGRARASLLRDRKSLFLDVLSVAFRRGARRRGITVNPAFAGAYAFTAKADYPSLFPRFLNGLPDGGLIMCHPGFVDPELERLDPLTGLREREFAYFGSDAFLSVLAARNIELAEPLA